MKWKPFSALLAAILLIKISFLVLDSRPAYFLGDSQAYLATATLKYIPPDRGFAYGLLLRRIALHLHSLEAMVWFQVLLSGVAAWLTAVYLVRFFGVRFGIAAGASLLCAVEPLQLLMERYIMTETAATFLFAVYLGLLLGYVRRGDWMMLVWAHVTAVVLIAIRLSFLPAVLVNSALVPLLTPAARDWRKSWRVAGAQLVVSIVLLQALIFGYKQLNGHMQKAKPALLYANGYFLLADLLPMVKPEDYPIASQRDALFRGLQFDTGSLRNRLAERWYPGEVVNRIEKWWPEDFKGNEIAQATAVHAMRRDPLGLLRIAWREFLDYFDVPYFEQCLVGDQGAGPQLPPEFVEQLETKYHVRAPRAFEPSLTKKWHLAAMPWYWVVLCSAPLWVLAYGLCGREQRPRVLVCVVAAILFLEGATLTVERPNARYLATAAWLELTLVGILADRLVQRARWAGAPAGT